MAAAAVHRKRLDQQRCIESSPYQEIKIIEWKPFWSKHRVGHSIPGVMALCKTDRIVSVSCPPLLADRPAVDGYTLGTHRFGLQGTHNCGAAAEVAMAEVGLPPRPFRNPEAEWMNE
jgi:hypothetical protein